MASIGPKQGLVQFDLSALGGVVTSATLTFNVTNVDVAGNVDFHVVLTPWNENTVTFNTAPSFDPAIAATLPIVVGDFETNVSLDISAIAQAWVNDPPNNNGLALVANFGDVRFSSKEGVFAANARCRYRWQRTAAATPTTGCRDFDLWRRHRLQHQPRDDHGPELRQRHCADRNTRRFRKFWHQR